MRAICRAGYVCQHPPPFSSAYLRVHTCSHQHLVRNKLPTQHMREARASWFIVRCRCCALFARANPATHACVCLIRVYQQRAREGGGGFLFGKDDDALSSSGGGVGDNAVPVVWRDDADNDDALRARKTCAPARARFICAREHTAYTYECGVHRVAHEKSERHTHLHYMGRISCACGGDVCMISQRQKRASVFWRCTQLLVAITHVFVYAACDMCKKYITSNALAALHSS